VFDVGLKRIADLLAIRPDIQYTVDNPPDGLPRLRCYCFFLNEHPADFFHARAQTWCAPNLRERCGEDKECSHKAAKLAIPLLLKEINVVKQPQQAEQRFRFLASNPDLF